MSPRISTLIWDAWNIEHISRHGISVLDIEWLISNQDPAPLFQKSRSGTIAVWGKDIKDRYLLTILVKRGRGSYYPVTARLMTKREKNRFKIQKNEKFAK